MHVHMEREREREREMKLWAHSSACMWVWIGWGTNLDYCCEIGVNLLPILMHLFDITCPPSSKNLMHCITLWLTICHIWVLTISNFSVACQPHLNFGSLSKYFFLLMGFLRYHVFSIPFFFFKFLTDIFGQPAIIPGFVRNNF